MSIHNRQSSSTAVLKIDRLVIDACVLLNLHASGRIEEILPAVCRSALVASYVAGESLWQCSSIHHGEPRMREPVLLQPIIDRGLIEVTELTAEEEEHFVRLAVELGDGEAASAAIALSRSAWVATDDRKARRICSAETPRIPLVGTPAILRRWAEVTSVEREDISLTLQRVRQKARFRPSATDGDFHWWNSNEAKSQ